VLIVKLDMNLGIFLLHLKEILLHFDFLWFNCSSLDNMIEICEYDGDIMVRGCWNVDSNFCNLKFILLVHGEDHCLS